MDIKLTLVSIEKDCIRVAVNGPITAGDFTADSKNPLEATLGQSWATMRVLMDFSKANYIDSSAIGWLIGTSRTLRESGGKLVLHNVQPAVRQILDVLRVGRVVPIADSEASARSLVAVETDATGAAK